MEKLYPSPAEKSIPPGGEILALGQVYKIEQTSDYQAIYLKNNSIHYQKQSFCEPRFIIYSKVKHPVKAGNIISAKGKISFFEKRRNPGNFDRKFYYQKQGIYASLWCDMVEVENPAVWQLRQRIFELRRRLKEVLYQAAGPEKGGILCAMILGEKTGMDEDTKELYQKNGIGHILAISGLHLSFIGIGIYRLLRRASGSFLIGGCGGAAFLILYILMIGVTVSAVRALVMFLIRIGADMSGRVYDGLTALSVAAVSVIIWRPLSYFDGGAQLSFGAVLGILAINPLLGGKTGQEKGGFAGISGAVRNVLSPGLSIHLVTFPAQLYHFYEFPPYSLLVNMLVLPLMPAILFLGLFGAAAGCIFFPAGGLCIRLAGWILDIYEILCRAANRLPYARIVTGQPGKWQIVVYLVCLAVFWLLLRKNKKKAGWLLALGGSMVLAAGARFAPVRPLETVMLDVGQGDGMFLRTAAGIHCMVDGGSSDVKQVGRYRIEPYLKSRGIGRLNYVFVTHGDADHMNGIEELIERQDTGVKIDCLVLPVQKVWEEGLYGLAHKARKKGVRVMVMQPGETVESGRTVITCLQPGAGFKGETGNAASLVLDVFCGEFDMLLTGDVEGEGEECLEGLITKQYDVLKAAHHGSKNSGSPAFLDLAKPDAALISAGRKNRYGHPHTETLERLANIGCEVYNTAEYGAITIITDGKHIRASGYLHSGTGY